MINSTVLDLLNKGFVETATGGGCKALVRHRDGKTDVVTDADGSWLPDANDWLFVTYDGDWLKDADAPIIVDFSSALLGIDSELPAMTLMDATDAA